MCPCTTEFGKNGLDCGSLRTRSEGMGAISFWSALLQGDYQRLSNLDQGRRRKIRCGNERGPAMPVRRVRVHRGSSGKADMTTMPTGEGTECCWQRRRRNNGECCLGAILREVGTGCCRIRGKIGGWDLTIWLESSGCLQWTIERHRKLIALIRRCWGEYSLQGKSQRGLNFLPE